MRLLELSSPDELTLTADLINDDIPPYAVLSHTWGADNEEVIFDDLRDASYKSKAGYAKIKFCKKQARKDDLSYFWVDTCCINKSNSTELAEAIISMYHWYRNAAKCYVYLSDVSVCDHQDAKEWEPSFRNSRWFTRGWTLQELIAPESVEFFSREGKCLGNKNTLEQLIHEITKIPCSALRGTPVSRFSVDERMQWTAQRTTKRKEDQAYCLLGIFGVYMPVLYGEGGNAFIRLKEEIDKSLGTARATPVNLQIAALDEATKQSLKDLGATDPALDMDRIENSKDPLLKDCYEWILKDPTLQEWRDSSTNPLLWISGDPGKGKTMLMIALVRELLDDIPQTLSAVTFFFCQSTDPRLNNAVSILRGLIWKLATDHPQLAKIFHDKYDPTKHMSSGLVAIHTLFSALSAMLEAGPETFILIDALDECHAGPEREELLKLIMKQAKSFPKARWLLASRNNQNIKLLLKPESYILSLELNEQHISAAVVAFIEKKTSELAVAKVYSPGLAEEVKEKLIRKAESTFLWVALASKTPLKVGRWKTRSTLDKLPPGLEDLYARMLGQVSQCEEEERGFCLQILRWVSLAFRPMSTKELITMAGLPKELLDDDNLSELIELCGSFIVVRNSTLYFIHQSAKDYLVGKGAEKLFSAGLQSEHSLVVDRSLHTMSIYLTKDMYSLRRTGLPNSTTATGAPLNAPLNAISYACSYWIEHLSAYFEGTIMDDLRRTRFLSDRGSVYQFLRHHLLHWFEALSLIGEVDKGIRGLYRLEESMANLRSSTSTCHKIFIHDAIRVLRQFRPAIEAEPLQVYCSTLIFSPENSIVRQNFKQDIPRWISTLPRTPKDWSACLQTLEGDGSKVNSVVFSPSGQQLASGSGHGTVRLWDAATGTCLHALEDHDGTVNSVVFSPSGQQLASGSFDRTVRLWDAATGTCLHTLEGHGGTVNSAVFSPGGQQLASGSFDRTVRLWDAALGTCLHTLEGHGGPVFSVVFSPSGQQLASGSSADTVWLWDAATGACLHTLKGHGSWVDSVAFSPSGQQLTSGSDDGTVRLWDAATGTCLHTLEGHVDWVRSVVFSPSGQQLASGSDDGTVRLWDAARGTCLHRLEGHGDWVRSVVFSPSGQQLASSSSDGAVRLWDAGTGTCLHTLEGYGDSVVFSPSGQQLASGSGAATVRLWDAATGACLQTLEGHGGPIHLVVFSPSGQQLASSSSDGAVRLWDASMGTCLHTHEGHGGPVDSVVLSPSDKLLASSSFDGTVRLWDAATGTCLHRLKGHGGPVRLVVFSPTGQQLASGSDDCTVRLWDVATGTCLHTLEGHGGWVDSAVFSPSGQQLASGSNSGTVRLWDAATGTCLHTLEGRSPPSLPCDRSVLFSPSGQQLASSSYDGTVRLWNAATGTCLHTLEGHGDSVRSMMFSPSGQQLASSSFDGTVRLWDAATGTCLHTLEGHGGTVNSVVFSPSGQQLASSSFDGTVRLWDAAAGTCLHTLEGRGSWLNSVMFSPSGQQLASGSNSGTVGLWDAATGTCQHTLKVHSSLVEFSFDGSTLVTDFGTLSLLYTPSLEFGDTPRWVGWGINSERNWITWNGTNTLWIPLEYRPRMFVVKKNRIGIGCSSGVVYILNLIPKNLEGSENYAPN